MEKRGQLKLIFFLSLALLVIPTVSAATTEITIKTAPFHDVVLAVNEPGSSVSTTLIEIFKENADIDGEVTFNFETSEYNKIDLGIRIKRDGQTLEQESFEDVEVGKPIEVEVYPSGYTPDDSEDEETETTETDDTNSTLDETTEEETETTTETQDASDTQAGVTGNAIAQNDSGSFPSWGYYGIGAFLILGMIVFFVMSRKTKIKTKSSSGTPPKTPEINVPGSPAPSEPTPKNQSEKATDNDPEIEEAEARIRELQREISGLKKKEKMVDAQKRYEEARRELERLRGSGNL